MKITLPYSKFYCIDCKKTHRYPFGRAWRKNKRLWYTFKEVWRYFVIQKVASGDSNVATKRTEDKFNVIVKRSKLYNWLDKNL